MSQELKAENPVVFVIKKGRPSGFKFVIQVAEKDCLITFENNRYESESPAHTKAIKALLVNSQINRNIMIVDLQAGEAVALAHLKANKDSAIKGGVTTETMKRLESAGSTPELKALSENAEIVKQMADEGNLMMTHDVVQDKPASSGLKLGSVSK